MCPWWWHGLQSLLVACDIDIVDLIRVHGRDQMVENEDAVVLNGVQAAVLDDCAIRGAKGDDVCILQLDRDHGRSRDNGQDE